MVRIAILDHDNHSLYVEDIDETVLNGKYNGSEQAYIDDNYTLGNYSWDYITSANYMGFISGDAYDLDEHLNQLWEEDSQSMPF